ncbi:MAG: SprB repeat-containing protein, partial [Bacteroidota bacterium]
SVCSDATMPFDLNFNAIGAPEIQSQNNVTNGCTGNISALGINPGTIDVNSTSPGNTGDYNALFDCAVDCQEFLVFTPVNDNPASITYQICGDVLAPACQDPDLYCTNITFNIAPALTVTGLGNDIDVCEGNNYPPIVATVSGGLPQYTYNWSGPNIDPQNPPQGNTINNPIQGTYELTVFDANNCTIGSQSITYTEIPLPTVNAGADQSYCSPQSPIQLSGSGGLGNNLTWSGGQGSFDDVNAPNPSYTPSMGEMNVGTFQLTLTGSNACGSAPDNVSITFNTANGISLTPSVTDITCFGASTGAISLTVNNGSGNYSYSWSNGANTSSITNLTAGLYSVTVNDLTYGCSISGNYVVSHLNGPPAFSVNLTPSNPTCSNLNNGAVTSTLNGGAFPFTYSWSNGLGSNPDLFNLGAGTYSLTVLDGNGCQASETVTLTAPQALVIAETVNDISCNGEVDGSISTTITGGTPGYNYSWGPNGEISSGISALAAGSYTLTVTDFFNCSVSETYTIIEPGELSASGIITDNICNGQSLGAVNVTSGGGVLPYTFEWNSGQFNPEDISGLSAGNYVFELTDANNCQILVPFLISEPPAININPSFTNITCFGLIDGVASTTPTGGTGNLSVSWNTGSTSSTLTGLAAGDYTVTIVDGNNCVNSSTITIAEPAQLIASATLTNPILCNGGIGEITVSATGGTPQYAGTGSFLVPAGTYNYTVTDLNDCNATTSITITAPQAITINPNSTDVTCFGEASGTVNVSVSGGTGNYTYAWTGPNSFTSNNQNLIGLTSGLYTLTVTDQNNCTQTSNTFISEPAPIQSSA